MSLFALTTLDPKTVTQRRTRIGTIVLALTAPAVLVMADLHWRSGFDAWKCAHLLLFTILFAQLAFGVAQAWLRKYQFLSTLTNLIKRLLNLFLAKSINSLIE